MAVLHGRKGDVQCLKVLVAASGSSSVTFKPTDDSRLSLVSPNASTLHQPNSIMLALGMSFCVTEQTVSTCQHTQRLSPSPQPY